MADTITNLETGLTTADGKPLKAALAAAQSRSRRRAFLLVLPLLLFILVTFIAPIGQMLHRSVHHSGFVTHKNHGTGVKTPIMVNLGAWFDGNSIDNEPNEAAYTALVADLIHLKSLRAQGLAGTRINYELPGSRSLFTQAAREVSKMESPFKEALLTFNPKWEDSKIWHTMRNASSAYSVSFYLAAMDRTHDADGSVVPVEENRRVYLQTFARTMWLSLLITFLTFILAYPIAHLLATLPLRYSNLLMIFVLLPFWTSLLVRTTSWMILLQSQGVLNDVMVGVGMLGDNNRIQMMYNQIGTVVTMTHILLPFMVLPLYSVMRPINPSYVRAARSLGATSWTAFRRIYFPQTVPGIGAGSLLVFILAVGYYITPALVGGAKGTLISNLLADRMAEANWSLAAALASLLLGGILILYWLYDRLVGIDNLKLG